MPRAIHHPNTDDIDLATVLRALGDPGAADDRAAAGRAAASRTARRCRAKLDMPVSTCSYHLRLLREAGVTRTRAAGTERWMSVRQEDLDARFPGLLDALEADQAQAEVPLGSGTSGTSARGS